MSDSTAYNWPGRLVSARTTNPTIAAVVFVTLLLLFIRVAPHLRDEKPISGLEIVGMQPGDTEAKAKQRYAENSRAIIDEATKLGKPYQVLTPTGPVIILPIKHIDEIKNHKDLSFHETAAKVTFATLPGLHLVGGFAGFRFIVEQDEIFTEVVRVNLTRSLVKIIPPLAAEASIALEQNFPPAKEWRSAVFLPTAVHLIARLSARIFLGEAACRDENWLRVSAAYAVDGIRFLRALRPWPAPLRPLMQYLLPERLRLRRCEKEARAILAGFIAEDQKQGPEGNALKWLDEVANRKGRRADAVACQLALASVAVHTTSMALTRVVFDLCEYPEWVGPLREEAGKALEEEGGVWGKAVVVRLGLLDSVLKESQRLNPVHLTLLTRVATADVTLPSSGLRIPKGTMLAVSSSQALRDPVAFPEPDRFVGDRFVRMTMAEDISGKWHYATTSAQHFGFGHGTHACPGRFLAADILKVTLAQMLLNYDWRFAEGHRGGNVELAQDIIPNPATQICFRHRESAGK